MNNAGLVGGWDWRVWDVLANGVVRGTDLALARMKQGGVVVQVRGFRSFSSYFHIPAPRLDQCCL